MCDCGAETETLSNFVLRCQFFANKRKKLLDDVYRIDVSIKNLNEESLVDVPLDNLIHMVFATEMLFEVAIECCREWDLNLRPLSSVQSL